MEAVNVLFVQFRFRGVITRTTISGVKTLDALIEALAVDPESDVISIVEGVRIEGGVM